MEVDKARELLSAERSRTEASLAAVRSRGSDDRSAANEPGDMFDPAESLVDEGLDDSVIRALGARLDAIERAERRLEAGTYGRSIRSGEPIPDDRLEADPAAELTYAEALNDGAHTI